MIVIDQNSAINSLNESLVPSAHLIDGRKELDWLYFLTEFSKLINFYNDKNTIEGNWNPFLLKDPVFLMASISKTNYKNLHATYKTSCAEIQKLSQQPDTANLSANALDKLFDHLTAIYKIIERWTHYMQIDNEMYDLKNYIIHEVKTKLSIDFWAIQAFRQYLYNLSAKGLFMAGISYHEILSFDNLLWSINKDKRPFWQIFGFETEQDIFTAINKSTTVCLNILTTIGDRLFNFLEIIIHHAVNEFKKLSHKKSKFPDTTLLRSFVHALKAQQEQLNGISQKHLDFYYTEILKQTELPAFADTVFLCSTLAKNDTVFTLPQGTLFNAGVDAQKNPILFASQQNVNLNPAVIKSVQTLSYQNQFNTPSFSLQTIAKPTTIQKDPNNKIMGWSTFGELNPDVNLPVNPEKNVTQIGISFASPILLLREGKRTITLRLEFNTTVDISLLQSATYYLSTQKSWLNLQPNQLKIQTNNSSANTTATITITLAPTDIAIEPFLINPDGLKCDFPMFKIMFQTIANPVNPPKITSITIDVKVLDVKTFQLYNDFGELNTKNPFPPFGPIPLVNSNFIIGNNEIFSKPLDSFCVEINWDKRPSDFETYYAAYNAYLKILNTPTDTKQRKSLARLLSSIRHKKPDLPDSKVPFSNASFTINFNLLQNKKWQDLKMCKTEIELSEIVFVPKEDNCNPIFLFDPEKGDPKVPFTSTSVSSYISISNLKIADDATTPGPIPGMQPDPNIQNQPLKFTDTSSSGFVKMSLTGPEYGFGSELYPNIVADIALQNGNLISMAKGGKVDKFVAAANLPFAPKIKTFTADYDASVTYKLDNSATDYPFQYFIYSPFITYKTFDSSELSQTTLNSAITGFSKENASGGFLLYPSFDYSGALFIELDSLICNSILSLYFQLARNSTAITDGESVTYFYLNNNGWNKIEPLSDGTNQFKCSGIIELPIPTDYSNNKNFMPGESNWISIAVSGDPESYSKTTFLQTNGFTAQRTGISFLASTQSPQIDGNVISKPQITIPQIASIIQPFPSFGGKAAENETNRNQRVSNTIKTKNRSVTPEDYYKLILENFNEIYYLKIVNKQYQNTCNVYLTKKVPAESETDAFNPLVTNCLENEIQLFLQQNASPFTTINVSNFNLEYVIVTAQIEIESGYQEELIRKNVNQALKIHLSPWISSSSPQIEIDQPLTDAKISTFLQTIEGVSAVNNVSFSTYFFNSVSKLQTDCKTNKTMLKAYGQATLLVTAPNHNINF
ncbi:hypothetical protein [Flavobacterium sp. N1736]|uniref:hypothetical protein n=1 Tax=Flavobacterium sp. N1736 TaxID=2986823 RepID=UPI002224A9F9|nr:hypothetical protein [Flavobacterium sp. N1736]